MGLPDLNHYGWYPSVSQISWRFFKETSVVKGRERRYVPRDYHCEQEKKYSSVKSKSWFLRFK